jgi:hypothetical protein
MIAASSRERAEPPTSSLTQIPPNPSAAAGRNASTGNISSSSHARANGIMRSRAKSWANVWKARCSSVNSKSMAALRNRVGSTAHVRLLFYR